MSKDLFAAFGDFAEEDSTAAWSDQPGGPSSTSHAQADAGYNAGSVWTREEQVPQANHQDEDEDDFGDFEDAAESRDAGSSPREDAVVGHITTSSVSSRSTRRDPPSKVPESHASKGPGQSPQENHQSIGNHPFAGRMDFLFEAGDDEYDAGQDELGDLSSNPEAAMAYSKRIIAQQEAAMAKTQTKHQQKSTSGSTFFEMVSAPESKSAKSAVKQALPKDPNVLFDADDVSEQDDDDDDDDFDDFEIAEEAVAGTTSTNDATKPASAAATPAIDLLGLDDASEPPLTGNTNGKALNHSIAALNKRSRDSTLTTRAQPDDEQWDDFETAATTKSPRVSDELPAFAASSKPQSTRQAASHSDEHKLPPTNVPPPAVILSLYPSLFAEADEALFKALGKLDVKQRQMLLAHPASHQFLKSYLGHCIVLGHVVAGRKLRWKRDQHLAQSMRIGPAAAGGKGGMKLTGVDKSESAKEDREVVDVLRLWKGQVGKLRTAVSAASSAPAVPKLPHVPDITDQMAVKALKPAEGGIAAPHSCALCGLKREERVAKVDYEVEDSFGDWWVQGTNMHLSCRNFWEEFERKLKSR